MTFEEMLHLVADCQRRDFIPGAVTMPPEDLAELRVDAAAARAGITERVPGPGEPVIDLGPMAAEVYGMPIYLDA